jgi:RHS repeat-associated protein
MAGDTWQPHRFTGKELDNQNGLNWYDFGARWFDVAGVPMWTSVDPLAEKYYNVSPYAYCNNNPVMFIDPDGRDYWSTNNKEEIVAFLNAIGNSQTQFDFSKWEHATDAEICGNLTYNDETHKFYTSYTSVVDGELNVIGKSFDANITPVSYSGLGYEGAYVYQPITNPLLKVAYTLEPLTYYDGCMNWICNTEGRITGPAPLMGMPPIIGIKGGKQMEKMGRAIKNMSGNRNVQQKQIDQLCRRYHLSQDQRQELHRAIHGEGYGYNEVEEVIKELFGK